MNIALDAQPLIDNQKTGVGFCMAGIVTAIQAQYRSHSYTLDYFAYKQPEDKKAALLSYQKQGGVLRPCTWMPGSLYRLLWNFLPIPYRLFFGRDADVTHFFNYHVPPGVSGKTVATVHDMAYRVFPETVRFKTKMMLNLSLKRSVKRADYIITDSDFSKSEIIRFLGVPTEKITVVPCGVDTAHFSPVTDFDKLSAVREKYQLPPDYLLYLGTLEPRKNLERLIEAYTQLKADKSDAPTLVLAGRKGWLYDSIFQKVQELGLEKVVLFPGYIADEDAPALYSGATAFVFPSLYEGFGMPPLEAMACGTPVLTSHASSLPEVVGDAAVLVDPYSVEEIKVGMEQILSDTTLRQTLSDQGLARAKTFTWERSAELVMQVYEKLLRQDD